LRVDYSRRPAKKSKKIKKRKIAPPDARPAAVKKHETPRRSCASVAGFRRLVDFELRKRAEFSPRRRGEAVSFRGGFGVSVGSATVASAPSVRVAVVNSLNRRRFRVRSD